MNSLTRLDKMLIRGAISKEEYLDAIGAYKKAKRVTMQTADGIITYLEAEQNAAMEMHETATANKDMEQALTMLIKAHAISGLLKNIKQS